MQSGRARYGEHPAYGFALTSEREAPVATTISVPGRVRPATWRAGRDHAGQPARRATAIHWHGMELDSYYDGVHGWSGIGCARDAAHRAWEAPSSCGSRRRARARSSITRTCTTIVSSRRGLYGALLVLEPDETSRSDVRSCRGHRPRRSRARRGRDCPERQPRAAEFSWKAGARHRSGSSTSRQATSSSRHSRTAEAPVVWRPLAKDGAPVPPESTRPTGKTDHCGRRDLRFRVSGARRPLLPVDQRGDAGGTVGCTSSGHAQMRCQRFTMFRMLPSGSLNQATFISPER